MRPRLLFVLYVLFVFLVGCTPNETHEVSSTNTPQITVQESPFPLEDTKTPDPAQMDIFQWESVSPDNKWIARGVFASPKTESALEKDYIQLIIQNTKEERHWTIIDLWREDGLGTAYPQPIKWSKDGRYFYFTNSPVVEGCKALPTNGSDLQRVDLVTGNVYEVIPQVAYWISLSPDESLLAYISQVDLSLHLRDVKSGKENNITIDPGIDFDAGNIFWSPKGNMLAMTLAIQPCTGDPPESGIYAESTSIIIIDPSTVEVRTLLKKDPRRLVTSAWNEDELIDLKDPKGNSWVLNLRTREVLQP